RGEFGHVRVVVLPLGEGGGEDRRVGGDADDVAVGDQLGEAARDDALTREVVEPNADADLGELGGAGGAVGHGAESSSVEMSGQLLAMASYSLAAATTCSVVMPNSRYGVL